MSENVDGKCRNGGCPRLATVTISIPMLGVRDVCYHCQQALEPYFWGDLDRRATPRSGQTLSTFPGAA